MRFLQWIITLSLLFISCYTLAVPPASKTTPPYRWVQLNGPNSTGWVRTIQMKNNPQVLFAYNSSNKLYRSLDGGKNWSTLPTPHNLSILNVASVDEQRLLLGAPGGVFISDDRGEHWKQVLKSQDYYQDFTVINPNLIFMVKNYLRDNESFYRSTDRGETWNRANFEPVGEPTFSLGGRDDIVLFGNDRLHVSTDGGLTFIKTNIEPDYPIASVAINHKNEIFVSKGGLYLYKTNLEQTKWDFIKNTNGYVERIVIDDQDNLYAFTRNAETRQLQKSTDDGQSWQVIYSSPILLDFTLLNNGQIMVVTYDGVLESDVNQQNFSLVNARFLSYGVRDLLAVDKQHFFAREEFYDSRVEPTLYRSDDSGKTWQKSFAGAAHAIAWYKNQLLLSDSKAIFSSDDFGKNWHNVYSFPDNFYIIQLNTNNNIVWAYGYGPGPEYKEILMWSSDLRQWQTYMDSETLTDKSYIMDGTIFLTRKNSVITSDDQGKTWHAALDKIYGQGNFLRGYQSKVLLACYYNYGIYKSQDAGKSWSNIGTSLKSLRLTDVKILDENTYIASTYDGVFVTLDGGNHWLKDSVGIRNRETDNLFASKDAILIATESGVYQAK